MGPIPGGSSHLMHRESDSQMATKTKTKQKQKQKKNDRKTLRSLNFWRKAAT